MPSVLSSDKVTLTKSPSERRRDTPGEGLGQDCSLRRRCRPGQERAAIEIVGRSYQHGRVCYRSSVCSVVVATSD